MREGRECSDGLLLGRDRSDTQEHHQWGDGACVDDTDRRPRMLGGQLAQGVGRALLCAILFATEEGDELLGNLRLDVWIVPGESLQSLGCVHCRLLRPIIEELYKRSDSVGLCDRELIDLVYRQMP